LNLLESRDYETAVALIEGYERSLKGDPLVEVANSEISDPTLACFYFYGCLKINDRHEDARLTLVNNLERMEGIGLAGVGPRAEEEARLIESWGVGEVSSNSEKGESSVVIIRHQKKKKGLDGSKASAGPEPGDSSSSSGEQEEVKAGEGEGEPKTNSKKSKNSTSSEESGDGLEEGKEKDVSEGGVEEFYRTEGLLLSGEETKI
jgi:hypothetical protein